MPATYHATGHLQQPPRPDAAATSAQPLRRPHATPQPPREPPEAPRASASSRAPPDPARSAQAGPRLGPTETPQCARPPPPCCRRHHLTTPGPPPHIASQSSAGPPTTSGSRARDLPPGPRARSPRGIGPRRPLPRRRPASPGGGLGGRRGGGAGEEAGGAGKLGFGPPGRPEEATARSYPEPAFPCLHIDTTLIFSFLLRLKYKLFSHNCLYRVYYKIGRAHV